MPILADLWMIHQPFLVFSLQLQDLLRDLWSRGGETSDPCMEEEAESCLRVRPLSVVTRGDRIGR